MEASSDDKDCRLYQRRIYVFTFQCELANKREKRRLSAVRFYEDPIVSIPRRAQTFGVIIISHEKKLS